MAAQTKKAIQDEALAPAAVENVTRPGDTVFTVRELAAAHQQQFGCSYEMVIAAFMHAGKDSATLAEAKDIVGEFRKKEVK